MQFSDTTDKQGIVQDARWRVNANDNNLPIEDLNRLINRRYDRAVSLIFQADGRWQWNDSNGSENIYTDDLVSGTQAYDILVSHLRITRVEVSDTDGNWTRLKLIDQNDVDTTITDFQNTDGNPRFYDLIGNKLYLYPAPDYNQTDGLKWWFQSPGDYFVDTDTTKVPGFASIFHHYLSVGAAYDYAVTRNLSIRDELKQELIEIEDQLQHFYNRRAGDENIELRVHNESYR